MLIDSLKFSGEKQSVRGALPVAGFDRLRDSLFAVAGDGGDISYTVRGGADARDNPVLRLKVSGQLALQCQRCLTALDYGLVIDTTLRLVPEVSLDTEMSDDPDEPDCIAASTELDLVALIEDEILLALPAYPRHEEGRCNYGSGAESEAGRKQVSAFGALSELGALKQKEFKSKE